MSMSNLISGVQDAIKRGMTREESGMACTETTDMVAACPWPVGGRVLLLAPGFSQIPRASSDRLLTDAHGSNLHPQFIDAVNVGTGKGLQAFCAFPEQPRSRF